MDREATALVSSLDAQRAHVLEILEGLSDNDLHRPMLPSAWSCVGLVRHLAVDVERFWFRDIFAGEAIPETELVPDPWHVPRSVSAESVFALYRDEIRRSNAIIAATPLDAPPANWPEEWPDWRFDDLRELMLHVITETAIHAGHVDVVRELIDGRQRLVVT
jgi:uncharacterized damage-inducible protein DinB